MRGGTVLGATLRRVTGFPTVGELAAGRLVELPGRGRTFVVDVAGPPGAPTLLLLHALACTANLSWFPVVRELSEQYRVVLFDQRWHGRGIRSPRFRLDDCADDGAAVLDVLGIDKAIPTGYSLGGSVAQLMWRRHPDRLEGLVLCATARNFRGTRRERLFFPLLQTAMLPLTPVAASRVARFGTNLPEIPALPGSDARWGRTEFRSTSAWSLPAVLAELGRFNSAPWIGEVDVPTSVVVTTRDHTIPVRRQLRLAAAIPGAEVVPVDGGHASLVLRADRFAPAVAAAAASVVARGTKRQRSRARLRSSG